MTSKKRFEKAYPNLDHKTFLDMLLSDTTSNRLERDRKEAAEKR